jgi:hypothetical protein
MTVTILLIVFSAFALMLFVLRTIGTGRLVRDEAELRRQIQQVDLDAFQNLTDPEEEEFLRRSLPEAEFRAVQRQRLRAAIDYLSGVSRNAALLLNLGQAARRSSDARIAEAGRSLVDNAVRLRLFSVLAAGKLWLRIAFPRAALYPAGIVDRYQQLTDRAVQLGRLQHAGRSVLISRAP